MCGVALLAVLPLPTFAQNPPVANPEFYRLQPARFVVFSLENPSFLGRSEDPQPATVEKSGTLPASDGQRLRLNADLGNLHIFTDASGRVSYRVIEQADSPDSGAQQFLREFVLSSRQTASGITLNAQIPHRIFRGRFQITIEVHIPNRYNVETNTGAGNIDVQSIAGTLILLTGGGNITVGDVAGSLRATTSGGHITAGNIQGDGILHTGGGHIRTGRISGAANLDTEGGNIEVQSARSGVTAGTAGGQIVFDDAAGEIHTRTGGGAVHLERISGPATLETDGDVFLKGADAPLHVSSASGSITAWLNKSAEHSSADTAHKTREESQLVSGEGDIILYIPRERAITIDAVVDRDGGHRIIADPSLPLRVSYQDSGSALHTLRCQCSLNGGGEILKIKAASGNIMLRTSDPVNARNAATSAVWNAAAPEGLSAANSDNVEEENGSAGFIEEMFRRVEESFWGGVPIESDELQKHLEHAVTPAYPQVARTAGIEGDVVLRAYVSSEGRVTALKVLAGPPILARAAVEAVRQWRYEPLTLNSRPTNVVATLVIEFRLQ